MHSNPCTNTIGTNYEKCIYVSDVVLGLDALPQGCLEALHCLALPCLDKFSKCLALPWPWKKCLGLALCLEKNALTTSLAYICQLVKMHGDRSKVQQTKINNRK